MHYGMTEQQAREALAGQGVNLEGGVSALQQVRAFEAVSPLVKELRAALHKIQREYLAEVVEPRSDRDWLTAELDRRTFDQLRLDQLIDERDEAGQQLAAARRLLDDAKQVLGRASDADVSSFEDRQQLAGEARDLGSRLLVWRLQQEQP